jgi:RimJ/RimL family protein N-acetyltransferase
LAPLPDRRHLVTDRLDLQPVSMKDADRLAPFHADHRVMKFLQHGVLSRAESDALVARYEAEWPALGFGSWTVVERATGQLIGVGGLRVHSGDLGITVRGALVPEKQNQGYGPELGRAAIAFAFDVVGIDRVIGVTLAENIAGQRSLEKFGMVFERRFEVEGRSLLLYAVLNPNRGHAGPQ